MNVSSLTSSFTNTPVDYIIIAVVIAIITIDAMRSGPSKAAALALALPLAYVLFAALPAAYLLGTAVSSMSDPRAKAAIFLVLLAVLWVLIKMTIGSFLDMSGSALGAILVGLATTAIALVVWLSVPELTDLWKFGPQIHAVFAAPFGFWWLLLSVAALAFARR